MNARWIATVLILIGTTFAGTAAEDLSFAQRLSARGFGDMATQQLDEMIKSSDPAKQKAGRYGKALVTKQEAQIAAARFLRALETGDDVKDGREAVLGLYQSAIPQIDAYVKTQGPGSPSAFLLADTLQEYAEFLVGSQYPDAMKSQRQELVDSHKDEAEKLFERAIALYQAVAKAIRGKDDDVERDTPEWNQLTNAEYQEAIATYRLALIYPKGARFNARSEDAETVLDTFLNEHFEELYGAFAMLYLGQLKYEQAVRSGDAEFGEDALNYFQMLFDTVDEDPEDKNTIVVLGKAFYWYGRTGNALANALGNIKKADPSRRADVIKMGRVLQQKMRYGAKSRWVLLAQLEVADALAADGDFESAVNLAGDVLQKARVEGRGAVVSTATSKLTDWVSHVGGTGSLQPALLSQIGDSLAAQGLTAKAIAFYEKAIAGSKTPEEIEQVANEGWRKIATAYRRDKRYFAAGAIGWKVVEAYLKSGEGVDSPAYQTASESCWQAVQAYKVIADSTKRSRDKQFYEKVVATFRSRFADHPQNADAAFGEALDLQSKEQYAEAAAAYAKISITSPSYWSAQLRVPLCYRRLAIVKDKANAEKWHKATLKAADDLLVIATKKSDLPQAKAASRTAMIFRAVALYSLQRWEESLTAVDAFFAAYPGSYPKKGGEFKMKITSLLKLKRLADAEAALAQFKMKLPKSSMRRRLNYDVYKALRAEYASLGGRARESIAIRAALLYEERLESTAKPTAADFWHLAEVCKDAARFADAGSAYADAAKLAASPAQRVGWELSAAEMKFKAARVNKLKMDPRDYKKILAETRELFTSALIRDPAHRKKLLPILAAGDKWPSKEQWRWISANPKPLLTAAQVYAESSPKNMDGRWIAIRLLDRVHKITDPTAPEGSRKFEFVNTWWEGAQLKLELYLAIAESGSAASWSKKAADWGHSFGVRINSQYEGMDGKERVATVARLVVQLKAAK